MSEGSQDAFVQPLLPDSVRDSVNKKAAKYARVAAKKKQEIPVPHTISPEVPKPKSSKTKSLTKVNNKSSNAPLAKPDAGFEILLQKPALFEKPTKSGNTLAAPQNAQTPVKSEPAMEMGKKQNCKPYIRDLKLKEFKLAESFKFEPAEKISYGLSDSSESFSEELTDAEELISSDQSKNSNEGQEEENPILQERDEGEYLSDQESEEDLSDNEEISSESDSSEQGSKEDLKTTSSDSSEEELLLSHKSSSNLGSPEEEDISEDDQEEILVESPDHSLTIDQNETVESHGDLNCGTNTTLVESSLHKDEKYKENNSSEVEALKKVKPKKEKILQPRNQGMLSYFFCAKYF